ncbi:MAG: hypothetical protein QXL94_01810 [Candidatus Parvarchaeum sp.]
MVTNIFNKYKDRCLTNKRVKISFGDFTGLPFYDDIILNPEYAKKVEGLTYSIKYMTPLEYLSRITKTYANKANRTNMTLEDEINIIKHDRNLINDLKHLFMSGIKIDMLVLDYARNVQEGRNRAYAVFEINNDTCSNNLVKVMVVDKYPNTVR